MSCIGRQIDQLRLQIPGSACKPSYHDCYGPVTASSEEMARLPLKNKAEHDAALAEWGCIHLGPNGCEAYEKRPLIYRLFGTVPNLPYPERQGPEVPVAGQAERRVHALIVSACQVLMQRPARR